MSDIFSGNDFASVSDKDWRNFLNDAQRPLIDAPKDARISRTADFAKQLEKAQRDEINTMQDVMRSRERFDREQERDAKVAEKAAIKDTKELAKLGLPDVSEQRQLPLNWFEAQKATGYDQLPFTEQSKIYSDWLDQAQVRIVTADRSKAKTAREELEKRIPAPVKPKADFFDNDIIDKARIGGNALLEGVYKVGSSFMPEGEGKQNLYNKSLEADQAQKDLRANLSPETLDAEKATAFRKSQLIAKYGSEDAIPALEGFKQGVSSMTQGGVLQTVGNVTQSLASSAPSVVGNVMRVGGAALTATGAGALVGVPLMAAGTGLATLGGAAATAGDVGSEAYDEAFKLAKSQGLSDANATLQAQAAARAGGVAGAGLGALEGFLGAKFGAGAAAKAGLKAGAKRAGIETVPEAAAKAGLKAGAKRAGIETVTEAAAEGAGQASVNAVLQAQGDQRSLMRGVAESSAQGAIGGLGMSAGTQALASITGAEAPSGPVQLQNTTAAVQAGVSAASAATNTIAAAAQSAVESAQAAVQAAQATGDDTQVAAATAALQAATAQSQAVGAEPAAASPMAALQAAAAAQDGLDAAIATGDPVLIEQATQVFNAAVSATQTVATQATDTPASATIDPAIAERESLNGIQIRDMLDKVEAIPQLIENNKLGLAGAKESLDAVAPLAGAVGRIVNMGMAGLQWVKSIKTGAAPIDAIAADQTIEPAQREAAQAVIQAYKATGTALPIYDESLPIEGNVAGYIDHNGVGPLEPAKLALNKKRATPATIIHEYLHGLTVRGLDFMSKSRNPEHMDVLEGLDAIIAFIRQHPSVTGTRAGGVYATTNNRELLAEALSGRVLPLTSNITVQDIINKGGLTNGAIRGLEILTNRQPTTLLQLFTKARDYILNAMGLAAAKKGSVSDAIISAADIAMDVQKEQVVDEQRRRVEAQARFKQDVDDYPFKDDENLLPGYTHLGKNAPGNFATSIDQLIVDATPVQDGIYRTADGTVLDTNDSIAQVASNPSVQALLKDNGFDGFRTEAGETFALGSTDAEVLPALDKQLATAIANISYSITDPATTDSQRLKYVAKFLNGTLEPALMEAVNRTGVGLTARAAIETQAPWAEAVMSGDDTLLQVLATSKSDIGEGVAEQARAVLRMYAESGQDMPRVVKIRGLIPFGKDTALGTYDPPTHSIEISDLADPGHIVHEYLHGVTQLGIDAAKKSKEGKALRAVMEYMITTMRRTAVRAGERNPYALTDEHELMGDMFKPDFLRIAAQTPIGTPQSKQAQAMIAELMGEQPGTMIQLFDSLIRKIVSFLGVKSVPNNMTELLSRVAARATDETRKAINDGYVPATALNRLASIAAYHGSPFEFSKFSLDHIGSGEGNQAFGWGLYFSDSKNVADWYRARLSSELRIVRGDGSVMDAAKYPAYSTESMAIGRVFNAIGKNAKADIGAAFKRVILDARRNRGESAAYRARENAIASFLEDNLSGTLRLENTTGGRVYTVNIDYDPDAFILWDQPLTKQSKLVQNALSKLSIGVEGKGTDIYAALSASLKSDRNASQELNSIGIKGIKYLDDASRATGAGGFNYVVFDDTAISILSDYQKTEVSKDTAPLPARATDETRKAVNSIDMEVVNTAPFRAWFGDSKVVNDNGSPRVMYTGTSSDKDFTSFKMPRNGTWFTRWPDVASDYAVENDSKGLKYNPDTRKYDDVNSASRVIPVYVKIENPYPMTAADQQAVNVNNYKAAQAKLFDRLRAEGYDGVQWGPSEWVAIGKASQIKSAIGNNGNFDPALSRIDMEVLPASAVPLSAATFKNQLTGRTSSASYIASISAGVNVQPVLQINKIKALSKGDETQMANLKNKLNDAVHDSQGPAKRWLQALPISENARERIINVLYLAPGKRDTILNNAMEKHGGDAMIKALAAIKKGAKGLTHETVTMWVGHWITANHVAEKNAMLVARRAKAHSDAAQAAALKPNDFRLKLKEAEALQAYTDQVKAVSSTNLDAGSENGPPHAMGVAGGMNNAQAASTMQAVEDRFDIDQLRAVADAVYDMNAFRLALDIEQGKTQVATVAKFLNITPAEQQRLQDLQDARTTGTVTEAMRDAARAIVRSEYVPMTGHPLSAIDDPTDGLFSTGAAQPNTGKDYVMEGRTRGIADNGIATSMKGLIRSATFAGYADFTSGVGEVYDMLTPEQRTAVGLSKENINGLTRGSDNVLLDGRTNNAVGYSIQDAKVLEAIRAGNVDEQDGLLRKFAMPTTRMFAYLVTQANPLFGPKNLVNDMIERSLIASTREYHTEGGSKVTIGATDVIANTSTSLSAVNRLIRGKADYTNDADAALRDFIEAGGLSTSREAFARDAKALAQRVRGVGTGADPRVAVRAVGSWIEKYNKQFDMVAPLASYLALRSAGVSKVDAAGGALDLMNYRKKGAKTSGFVTPLYAFAQPAFTGGANLLKMLGTPKGKKIAVTALAAFLALQALSEAGADEDEGGNLIRQLPNYARNNNINVQMGSNIVSIPVGFGVTKLANTAARAILDFGNKGNSIPKSIYDVLSEGFMTSLTPFEDNDIKDPVKNIAYGTTPTVLKGAAGYALNARADGGQIDREKWIDQGKYRHMQGSKTIAPAYRDMAEMLYNATGWDMTPDAMKYLVQSYGIGPFKHVVANTITNPQKEAEGKDTGLPVVGSFIAPVFKPVNEDAWRGQMRKAQEDMDDMRKETEKLELDKTSEGRQALRELQARPEYRLMGQFDVMDKGLRSESAAVTRSLNKKQITATEEERRRDAIRDRRKDAEAQFLVKWRKTKGLE